MITLIHGEDTLSSYKRLTELIEVSKTAQLEIVVKDASELDLAQLRQDTSIVNLFGVKNCLVIKNLLGGTKSKTKDALIQSIVTGSESEIILYESKKLTEAVLKPFSKAKIEAFNINPVIFKFLDSLLPENTQVILSGWNKLIELGHEPEYVFAMLVRQVRLLIQAKSGASYLKLSPYPKKLITSQATFFTLNQLLDLHNRLYQIDKRVKTGLSSLPLEQLLLQFFYSI
ncbi:MAG: hypothetical protein UX08_C0002G0019 [Candidatus Collierbacteria bacterium GW2011_GWB1_45_35]|uniref:DNA-directed DNA polymerase n=2 Tax=Candidatus Collieribacteriota TaxID=1752725 RepID=A0A0G1KQP2_9BACT|nr:MAG: hypothetical protein UW48_C0004G0029 [Microgenomates group bacterium GW2011_GWC1_44_23]KKT85981.1 MAG: hypothetical protein UW84_C0018G0005 [Candidatus Collierbacteria bacterium GW2011_GWA2_44_99]KKT95705.1 MAG: hypothetical protein UW96_C0005G0029 [Candidatus Collierbacteria bacterium GW2011_GWA1_45_15]KKU00352.1 MAG: hypothetical protein UX01_C0005G0029 [Candidatus Collierbacteria bacterium GW2011_GWB2_45_17]KKU05804.1 MAG: hypothetical protein UX08_C0002G0019 [Candidatus Collierbacte